MQIVSFQPLFFAFHLILMFKGNDDQCGNHEMRKVSLLISS
jgi:hypothetical protein